MSYVHKKKLTSGQKWRSAIIIVEILILFLAIFLSMVQTESALEAIVQIGAKTVLNDSNVGQNNVYRSSDTTGITHHLAFYIDTHNRVHILDNDSRREFAQFDNCPVQMLLSNTEDSRVNSTQKGAIYITLASVRHGVLFDTASYEVIINPSTVTVLTKDNGRYQIAMDCTKD